MNDSGRAPVPAGGGLNIPVSVGIPEDEQKQIAAKWDTLESVVDAMNRWGFPEATDPQVPYPQITPELLSTSDLKMYTVLYTSQLRWFNYAAKLLARVEAELLQVTNEMTDIGARTKQQFRSANQGMAKKDQVSETEIKDQLLTHPRFSSLKLRQQELEQFKIELKASVEELESGMKVISRQVEIRKEEANAGRNDNNMPRRAGELGNRRL